MERHFSTGASTIVALMAAHREAQQAIALGRRARTAYTQDAVARIEAYLRDTVPQPSHARTHVRSASNSHLQTSEAAL